MKYFRSLICLSLFVALLVPSISSSGDLMFMIKDKNTKEPVHGAEVLIYIFSQKKGIWKNSFYGDSDEEGLVSALDLDDYEKYMIKVEAKGYLTYLYEDRLYFQIPDILELGSYGLIIEVDLIPSK